MLIQKKRINNITAYLGGFTQGSTVHIGVPLDGNEEIVKRLSLESGIKVLPDIYFGKASEYNAEGKWIKRKDLPMETFEIALPWALQDRGGNWHHGINYITRERYKRELIPPYEVYLHLSFTQAKETSIVSDELLIDHQNKKLIQNTINMFLEIFGRCYIMNESFTFKKEKKIDWIILPSGKRDWKEIKKTLKENALCGVNKKRYYIDRIEHLDQYSPSFYAIGRGGYSGYSILGFEDRGIYVAENARYGNATYIFNGDRESCSRLDKQTVITGSLAEQRIYHNSYRKDTIKKLFEKHPKKEA